MENFKVGDRVVCIDPVISNKSEYTPNLIKGREYIIYGIENECCRTTVDVGFHSAYPFAECSCGNIYEKKYKSIWYLKASRFRKVEEKHEVNYVKLEVKIEEPCLN